MLQREQDCTRPESSIGLESAGAATYAPPLSCPNHEGKVSNAHILASYYQLNVYRNVYTLEVVRLLKFWDIYGVQVGHMWPGAQNQS